MEHYTAIKKEQTSNTHNKWMNGMATASSKVKEGKLKRLYTVWMHLYNFYRNKTTEASNRSAFIRCWVTWGNFGDHRMIPYLDRSYTTIYSFSNFSEPYTEIGAFYIFYNGKKKHAHVSREKKGEDLVSIPSLFSYQACTEPLLSPYMWYPPALSLAPKIAPLEKPQAPEAHTVAQARQLCSPPGLKLQGFIAQLK